MAAGGGQEGEDSVIKGDKKLMSPEEIERAIKEGTAKDIDAPKDPPRATFTDDPVDDEPMLSNASENPLAWAMKPDSGVELKDEYKDKK